MWLCSQSWAVLGAYVGGLGPTLRCSVGGLGPLLGLGARSWAALAAYVGALGPLLGLCGWSWAALGAYVAEKYEEHVYFENVLISRVGARSAASRVVLGCSWTLCWRSWAALGAYVGDLGPLLGSMLAVLGRLGAYVGGLGSDRVHPGDPGVRDEFGFCPCPFGPCSR